MPVSPSEVLVERLARRSFLSLWSEANPRARPGKELCDLLIVCDPDVILISVKEAALERGGDPEVDASRWRRRAIDKSVEQLYGAERQLARMARVIRADGSAGLTLPSAHLRRVHRIAVALGAGGALPTPSGNWGKGFVHMLDELTLDRILGELDTVTDVVGYLRAKEDLAKRSQVVSSGNEADLLAVYLHGGRRFAVEADILLIEPHSWEQLTAKAEWKARKEADAESYVWDGLIEILAEGTGVEGSVGLQGLDERESVLRVMAREDRFARRVLARQFNEFMKLAAAEEVRARQAVSPSGVVYVFLATDRSESREHRGHELRLRCFVTRGLHAEATTVIGLATERYLKNAGFSLDVARLTIETWTPEQERAMRGIQADLGYFVAPRLQRASIDEYPT
jgi:hypothetical protein